MIISKIKDILTNHLILALVLLLIIIDAIFSFYCFSQRNFNLWFRTYIGISVLCVIIISIIYTINCVKSSHRFKLSGMLAVIGFPALKGITNTITSGYMPIADNVPIWLRNEMPIFYFTLILTAVSVMIALIIFLLIHSLNIGIYQKNLRKYN